MDNYKMVLVKWIDSEMNHNGWIKLKDISTKVSFCYTVGFLVYEDEKIVSIFLSIEDYGNICDGMNIPKSSIIEMTELEIKNK